MQFILNPLLSRAGKLFQLSQAGRNDRAAKAHPPEPAAVASPGGTDTRWLKRGYIFILVFLAVRLAYLAAGRIELSEDEAYQWVWSKHPALSYYSKPPMIAYTQFLGTALWGDNQFGIRFFSPVIAALILFLMLRFLAREVSARAGFWLVVILSVTPMMAVGATLLTIDPLSVLFWTASSICSWRAVQKDSFRSWCWAGLWLGFGFFSKYTALFQLLSWALFFVVWPASRNQLRRPGPYVALMIAALFTVPVLIWNYQHGWATMEHLYSRSGLDKAWEINWRYFLEFVGGEWGILNPVFSVGLVWAAIACWRSKEKNPFLLYLFSTGAPVFIFYLLYNFRSRVQLNWIAPSVVPLFALMVAYFEPRWEQHRRRLKGWLIAGLVVGGLAVVVMHEPVEVARIIGWRLPASLNPLRRVTAWSEMARMVGAEREKLLAEGKPVFLIGEHYGTTAQLTFYLPEAKRGVPDQPLAYAPPTETPDNQFFFWPGYEKRKGENALFVTQVIESQAPVFLVKEFDSVTDLGLHDVCYNGQVYRRVQIFVCRNLR
ncbi:MAG: arnT [Pedosphaera sp.]|nr:arnT [Pedosphaera sp.]